jgi:hypothetical protein
MDDLSPSLKLFYGHTKAWSEFNLIGEEVNENSNELKRSSRLINTKSHVCLQKTT